MKIKMPNGEIHTVPEGVEPADFIDAWVDHNYKKTGYNPNFKEESKARTEVAQEEAGQKFIAENPHKGLMASYQAGAKDLGRNFPQVVKRTLQAVTPKGLEEYLGVDDETLDAADEDISDKRRTEQPLKAAAPGMHMAGQIVPTLALGGTGKLAQGATALSKAPALASVAPALSKVAKMLKAVQGYQTTVAGAAAEGATVGAAVAGPGDRTRGAMVGAATGGGIALGGKVLHRTLASGIAKHSDEAVDATRRANQEHMTPAFRSPDAEKVFVPLSRSSARTGTGGGARYTYDTLLANVDPASRKLTAQMLNAEQGTIRNFIREGYGQYADDVLEALNKPGGRLDNALQVGDDLIARGPRAPKLGFTKPVRTALGNAARMSQDGSASLKGIGTAAKKVSEEAKMAGGSGATARTMQETADAMQKVLYPKIPAGEKGLGSRQFFYEIVKTLKYHTPLVGRAMASPKFQNFLVANTFWQKPIKAAVAAADKTAATDALIRAYRAYETQDNVTGTEPENMVKWAKETASQLRGMADE